MQINSYGYQKPAVCYKKRNYLNSFTVVLVHHCNLNCYGCDAFSPLAKEEYENVASFERNFSRLSELTNQKVDYINLSGGETLLHPQLIDILSIARKYFPNTKLRLLSNGLLMFKQSDLFWNSIKENNITICLTKYPIKIDFDKIKMLCVKKGVLFEFYNDGNILKTSHKNPLDLDGKQNSEESFNHCWHANWCIQLEGSKIATCPICLSARHFNEYFNAGFAFSQRNYIDIFHAGSIDEILEFLVKPIPFCKYCNVKERTTGHKWSLSKRNVKKNGHDY